MFPTKTGSSSLFFNLSRYNRFRSSASPPSNSDSESIRSSPSHSTRQTPSESIRSSPSHPTRQTPASSQAEGEGSSIYAEAGPFPAIEGLQISGESFPGRILQACGFCINETTLCIFEWIRHAEDGSLYYIEGATQPKYLITADDVDSYLAVVVQPMDNRGRKGDIAKVFANGGRKITCDPNMQDHIEKTLSIGHISYEVLLSFKYMDIREQAVLTINWSGYSLKSNGPCQINVTEKFLPSTAITIPVDSPTEFLIQLTNGDEYLTRTIDSRQNRDIIILTMRLFQKMAVEKMKRNKKGSIFKS